ncbi:hypothetical protein PPL_09674 [Heterostelium album PN500]|uniref:Uncharacterized protein n=1 Tax=Heterostelium pallidum (strain ATCC 26659 / Pp 5 / PN500) TaxID=670386 RepID=D3BNH1_HETP5|nr:hypothetical protein PPL_09674 [Heterostelium album PN500]EFA76922.1 hypothetical protein PPL_09674 [Heterostelium album PN500]|eukprot:XP_020429054.1 hypothetical protein PPL_09674 [Heterostelium album PN500]
MKVLTLTLIMLASLLFFASIVLANQNDMCDVKSEEECVNYDECILITPGTGSVCVSKEHLGTSNDISTYQY